MSLPFSTACSVGGSTCRRPFAFQAGGSCVFSAPVGRSRRLSAFTSSTAREMESMLLFLGCFVVWVEFYMVTSALECSAGVI